MEFNHNALCHLAAKWLKRPQSQGGHGCHISLAECRSGWDGEIPDAIGFKASGGHDEGSIVIEVKVSRSDFLADKKKPHRTGPALGDWRYFMAPEGIIKATELPEKWGLLEVNSRGHIKTVVGVFQDKDYYKRIERMQAMRHDNINRHGEMFVLVKLLSRIENAGGLHEILKENFRLQTKCNDLAQKERDYKHEISRLRRYAEIQQTPAS